MEKNPKKLKKQQLPAKCPMQLTVRKHEEGAKFIGFGREKVVTFKRTFTAEQ